MAGENTDVFGSFFGGLDTVLKSQTAQTITQIIAGQNQTAAANTGTLPPADNNGLPPANGGGMFGGIPSGVVIGGAVVVGLIVVYAVMRKR